MTRLIALGLILCCGLSHASGREPCEARKPVPCPPVARKVPTVDRAGRLVFPPGWTWADLDGLTDREYRLFIDPAGRPKR